MVPITTTVEAVLPAGLAIDYERRSASFNDLNLYLTEREFALLVALAASPERTLDYEELLVDVFPGHAGPSRRILDAVASRLRRKLEIRGAKGLIAPSRGVGFRLAETTTEEQCPEAQAQPVGTGGGR